MRKLIAIATTALLLTLGASTAQALPAVDVAPEIHKELCEHFAAGFTVEDSVSVQRSLFGEAAAEEWRSTVEAVEASGCTSIEPASVNIPASTHSDMLADMRQNMTTVLKDESDTVLLTQAYAACTTLLVQDKDTYRENTFDKYGLDEGLDRLVLAGAAKHYLCG